MSDQEPESTSSSKMLEGLDLKALLSSGLPSEDASEDFPELPGYQIVDQLGRGGMGSVFLAKQLSLDRLVAVKVLHVHHSITGAQRSLLMTRLESEARVMAKLNHPHLVSVYDFVNLSSDEPGSSDAAIIMEYVRGGNVREKYLPPQGDLVTADEVILVADHVSACLSAAHSAGVIHRDIKPENLLIDSEGTIKVSDFGLALDGSSVRMTVSGTSVGSPGYSAPEQLEGLETDERADIYSLGVVMYELLSGIKPMGDVKRPRDLRSDVPEWLDDLIILTLQPNREKRIGSVAAFREALATRRKTPSKKPGNATRRLISAAATLALCSVAFLTWWNTGDKIENPAITATAQPEPLNGTVIRGRWQQRSDGYHSGEGLCLIGFSKAPEITNRTVSVEFTRESGFLPVAVFFRHPNGIGTVLVDAYRNGLGGLEVINGETLRESPNAFSLTIENGRRYRLDIQIENNRVVTMVDGDVLQDLRLSDETLSVAGEWNWRDEETEGFSLLIGTFKSPATIHSVSMKSAD